jgi:hypothetical protein
MKSWFCQYSRDGLLTLHITFSAVDREDAYFVLEDTFEITDDIILDLHEILT